MRTAGFRIATGFVGTPLVMDALTATGHVDVAYRLLLQTGCPSWLYPVTMGATTVWERWDSMLPDGSVNPGEMTSFNHYALGAVVDWLHRAVAGLAPVAPGYREIEVHPEPTASLTRAAARHLTPYGEASVAWQRQDGQFHLDVLIPVGATATVHVPGEAEPVAVARGAHSWRVPDPAAPTAPGGIATVREVLDAPSLWAAVVDAAVRTGAAPKGEAQVASRLAPYLDAPASELARGLLPGETAGALPALSVELNAILPGSRRSPDDGAAPAVDQVFS